MRLSRIRIALIAALLALGCSSDDSASENTTSPGAPAGAAGTQTNATASAVGGQGGVLTSGGSGAKAGQGGVLSSGGMSGYGGNAAVAGSGALATAGQATQSQGAAGNLGTAGGGFAGGQGAERFSCGTQTCGAGVEYCEWDETRASPTWMCVALPIACTAAATCACFGINAPACSGNATTGFRLHFFLA